MAGSSTLDPDNFPTPGRGGKMPKGHDTRSLGPSDSSDSGSDMAGTAGNDPRERVNADRYADRVVGTGEAGLGGGMDQAEEARLGKTDEDLEREARKKPGR